MLTCLRMALFAVPAVIVASASGCAAVDPQPRDDSPATHTTVTYRYDPGTEGWIETTSTETIGEDRDASGSALNNTLIVQLRADTPVKEIVIDGGLVIGGADPVFEIDGDPSDSAGGSIRIGRLALDTVDARRLQIRDTQVVSSNMTNVSPRDDELELSFQTVAVVFVERGAGSTLLLRDSRVDRIRILGVGRGVDTHLEQITITRSGFVGTMRIEDAKIDTLILKDVSLEE